MLDVGEGEGGVDVVPLEEVESLDGEDFSDFPVSDDSVVEVFAAEELSVEELSVELAAGVLAADDFFLESVA